MPDCNGPCMEWCSCSLLTIVLAYSMLAYIGACVGYLLLTRDMGTPFMDSLTPEQRRIKEYSVDVRTCAFTKALGITILALILLRPLRRQPVS